MLKNALQKKNNTFISFDFLSRKIIGEKKKKRSPNVCIYFEIETFD